MNQSEPSAGLMADDDDDDAVCSPYQPPQSLWQLIESCTSSHELPEVKRLLGESLVEQSVELHREVSGKCCEEWCNLYLCVMSCLSFIYTVSQKNHDTRLLPVTTPNANRFSKFFH